MYYNLKKHYRHLCDLDFPNIILFTWDKTGQVFILDTLQHLPGFLKIMFFYPRKSWHKPGTRGRWKEVGIFLQGPDQGEKLSAGPCGPWFNLVSG